MDFIALPRHNLILINGVVAIKKSIDFCVSEFVKLDLPFSEIHKQKYFKIYNNFLKRELGVSLHRREQICSTNKINAYKNVFLICIECLTDCLPQEVNKKKFIKEIEKTVKSLNQTEWDSLFHITTIDCFSNSTKELHIYKDTIPGDVADQVGIITSLYL